MNCKLNKVNKLLKEYNQQHLLKFYDELNEDDKELLLDEILEIDFELIKDTYKKIGDVNNSNIKNEFNPMIAKVLNMYSKEEKENFYNMGIDALKDNKVAVCLVAGGQGTRLGHNGPKGTFNIGLPSNKSLFQIQCERLIYLSKQVGKYIPFYIMTSTENYSDTVNFFKENNYFGYDKDKIMFFKQNNMPAINEEGKICLANKNKINMSANGNGGCFISLKESGALKNMKNQGVEWIFLYGVDNALVKIADPYFIGFTISSNQLAASKVVAKKHATEKVGVLCYKNNKPSIVEYSELPRELSDEIDSNGKIVYSNANILNHLLNIKFIDEIVDKDLPLHTAHKKIKYINENNEKIEPCKPNGYKFEYFLFDTFELLDDMAVLEVLREEEFAPVKNADGDDSPKTARDLTLNLHKKWLTEAGLDKNILKNNVIEISPLTSYNGENLNKDDIAIILKDNNL